MQISTFSRKPWRRPAAPAQGGGGGNLVHNSTFVVTGSGFGTKSSTTKPTIADYGDAGAGNFDTQWDGSYPQGVSSTLDMRNRALPHDNAGTSSGTPHSNCSVAMCAATPGGTPATQQNAYAYRNLTWSGADEYSYWSFYHRAANNWTFGDDNNYKTYGISTDHDSIYNLPDNWYEAYNTNAPGGHTDFWNNTNEPIQMVIGDDSGYDNGGGIVAWGGHWSSLSTSFNFAKNWVKVELLIRWNENSSLGFIRGWQNNVQNWNFTTATDSRSNSHWNFTTLRCEGIGGFLRNCSSTQFRYWVDIYHSRDANPGRFVLTNNATYASATVVEVQPYTSWSATSVMLKCKKGALSSGTVHLHYRDEVNGHQYLGTRTMT